jgi:predicted RNA-binding Zn-ribbon protein involved in translation (DUF1610 family)
MGDLTWAAAPGANYTLTCHACQGPVAVSGEASSFDCGGCGRRNFVVGCARCQGATIVAGRGTRPPTGWNCAWCLEQVANVGLARLARRPEATVNDAWRSLQTHGLTNGDPHVRLLAGFEMLAGNGDCPPKGAVCSIAALADGALIIAEIGAQGSVLLPYDEILELEAGGRGEITTPGAYIGGGHGLRGALTGIALAKVLNDATRTTSIESFLRLTAQHSEMVFRHPRYTPQTIRGSLSRLFTAQLAATRTTTSPPAPTVVIQAPPPPPSANGPVDELERLTKLHAAGTLTDTEFETARAQQIKRLKTEPQP